ncbi:MAG: LytTR family DNA-binding domain-containing protein [Opitutus sp.]
MRILIVEDEAVVARRVEKFCREILGDQLESVRVSGTFEGAWAILSESAVDLLLLDLNMAGQDGMALLESSVAGSFHTIIVSANTEQAMRAFDHGVIDFVGKPFTIERLSQALRRVSQPDGRSAEPARCLAIRKQGRIQVVPVSDVHYIQGAGDYSQLVLADGRRELHDKSLERLQTVLPPVFERIHKSFLVRRTEVICLHTLEGSQWRAELKDGTMLPVGRTYYRDFRAKLQ